MAGFGTNQDDQTAGGAEDFTQASPPAAEGTAPGGMAQLTPEIAAKLRDMGQISPDTYQMMFPAAAKTEAAQPEAPLAPPPNDVLSNVMATANARRAAETAAKAEADAQVSLGQAEVMKKVLQYNVNKDIADGLDETAIRKKYAADIDRIKSFEDEAAAARGGAMVPAMAEMPNGGGAPATAAAGTLPTDYRGGAGVPRGTSQSGMGLSPAQAVSGAIGELGLDRGLNMEAAAIREASKVGQAKATEQSAYLDQLANDNERRVKSHEAATADRQRQLEQKAVELERATSELARTSIDPDRFWKNKSTADRVSAGIGLLLGAVGASANGGVNMAVKTIDDAIGRDIDLQKVDIANKKDVLNARTGLYAKMHERFKDAGAAEDATRIAYLEAAKLKVEAIGARYGSAETKAKADQLVAQIAQKQEALRASFIGQMSKSLPFSSGMDPELLTKDQRERIVPGYDNLALSDKDATAMKVAVGETSAAKGAVSSLLNLANQPGASTNPVIRAEADTTARLLEGALRTQVLGPGAVTDKERELLQDIIANPTKIFQLDAAAKARLNTLQKTLDRNLASKASGYGLKTQRDSLGAQPLARK